MSECACYHAIWGDIIQYVPHYTHRYDMPIHIKNIPFWKQQGSL